MILLLHKTERPASQFFLLGGGNDLAVSYDSVGPQPDVILPELQIFAVEDLLVVEAQFHLAVCGQSFLECPGHDLLNIRPRFIVQHTGIAAHHIDIAANSHAFLIRSDLYL